MISDKRHFGFHSPLNEGDSSSQTVGCRASTPENCKFCMTPQCAFSNKEGICKNPPRSWKKQYEALKQESSLERNDG